MACELANTRLEFEYSHIVVRPFDVTYTAELGQFDYLNATISETAARLIAPTLTQVQPVSVYAGDTLLRRLVIEPDGIEVGANDRAFVRLRDPRILLQRGIISAEYDPASLSTVTADILRAVPDPLNIIKGVRFTSAENLVSESQYETIVHEWLADLTDEDIDLIDLPTGIPTRLILGSAGMELEDVPILREAAAAGDGILDFITGGIRGLANIDEMEGGFSFEDITPLAALRLVEQEFGLYSWVDDDGYLWVGRPEDLGKPVPVGESPGDMWLTDHRVISQAMPVKTVIIEGPYKDLLLGAWYSEDSGANTPWVPGSDDRFDFRARATVTWTGVADGKTVKLNAKQIGTLYELEAAARYTLRKEIYEYENGTLTMLPEASERNGSVVSPESVWVGDHLLVGALSDCAHSVDAGMFGARRIQHKINADDGWELEVAVGRLVTDEAVDVKVEITNFEMDGWTDAYDYYGPLLAELTKNTEYNDD